MSLQVFWFGAVAVLWTGFFVLEGFDFGVGMLHRFLGHDDGERRVLINTIGPFWDGNEVWLIVAGASVFAAFPGWYATWFSAGYLALVLVLMALILRGVSFEFRGRVEHGSWRSAWSWAMTVGSALAPLLLGVALGDLLAGLPVGSNQEFTGTFWDLLTPYGLYLGVTMLLLCLLHGGTFLGLRTLDALRDRSHRLAVVLAWPAAVLVLGFAVWTPTKSDQPFAWSIVPPALAVVAAVGAALLLAATARRRVLRRDRLDHRAGHALGLHQPVSERAGVHHQPGLLAHRDVHGQRSLRPHRHDGGRARAAAGRAALPGLDLRRVPPPPVRPRHPTHRQHRR